MSYHFYLLLIFIIPFLPSCHTDPHKDPDTLIIGLENSPTQLDPRLATDLASAHISKMVYNGLLKMDADGNLAPDLALDWEMPDEKTIVVHLKKEIRFHDGKELDSGDVLYTFQSIADPDLKSPKAAAYEQLDLVEAPSPHTVIFRLKEPHSPFLYGLLQEIVPREQNQNVNITPIQKPVGTGPFRFVRYLSDEEVLLEANTGYFDGPPRTAKLSFRIIPDETTRILELEKGNIHLLQNAFSPDLLPRLRKNQDLKIVQRPGTNYSYIGFNLEDPILKKREVREAIARGIDRPRIINSILKGLARPAESPLPSSHWAYEPAVARYPFNPERAKELLDQAGFPDPDGNGPLPRFTLEYKTSQNELRRLIAEVIARQLSEIGIEAKIKSYEWGAFYDDIKNGNFQMFTLTWVGIQDPDFFREAFHSQNIPPRGANRGKFVNAEVDRLTELGARTMYNEERKKIYSRIQEIIAREIPYAGLWHAENTVVMKKNLKGFKMYPDESLAGLKDVYFSN